MININGNIFNLKMANRHGAIAGATGTGKTTSLRILAKELQKQGVTVIATDVKGDFCNGFDAPFVKHPLLRVALGSIKNDLLARFLNLSEVQTQVLYMLDKINKHHGFYLETIKGFDGDINATAEYGLGSDRELVGNISKVTLTTMQRMLGVAELKGLDALIVQKQGDPSFDFLTLLNAQINVLECVSLVKNPELYSAYILNMLDHLYSELPEIGDIDKPKVCIFIDEAHLIFNGLSKTLLIQFEQIIKLIRSKGVGLYFCSQSISDLPDAIQSQLSNRIQHGLRAYTAKEQTALKAVAKGFRADCDFDVYEALLNLGIGEAIVSFLDQNGIPTKAVKTKIKVIE